MKKTFIFTCLFGAFSYIVFSSNQSGYGRSGGDASGASGAGTGINQGCQCHGTANNSIAVTVELDSAGTAVTHYRPGASYTIKISGTNNGSSTLPKFGFQLAAVLANSAGVAGTNYAGAPGCTTAGTWGTLPSSVRNTASSAEAIIEQSTAIAATTGSGSTGTTYVESIPWTAPAAGSGAVVIYGVLNAVNGDGNTGGDMQNVAKTMFVNELGKQSSCN